MRALSAQKSAQTDLREIRGLRHPDLGIGGDQVLLRGANVRPPLQQGGRQTGGHLGRQLLLGQAATADDFAGILSQQQADLVLGLFDALLQFRNRFGGSVYQLFSLAQIEQRRDAAALAGLG